MAPSHSRQLLVWTLPTIAVLLSYLWYKRKRIGAPSDPGDRTPLKTTNNATATEESKNDVKQTNGNDSGINISSGNSTGATTPNKSFSRSLSGVESTPIDIIIPRELRSVKTPPVVISDEDLDIEIEKVKSMKTDNKKKSSFTASPPPSCATKTPSPKASPPTTSTASSTTPPTINNNNNKENVMPFKCKKTSPKRRNSSSSTSQKDMETVEGKLTSLSLTTTTVTSKAEKKNDHGKSKKKQRQQDTSVEREDLQRQSSERDSANHSPVDAMLASPSLSSISDNHSEGSNDSGKGGSDVATPPPSRTPGTEGSMSGDIMLPVFYEFLVPQTLVGKLIGKSGYFVAQVNEKANATMVVRKHPSDNKLKVCSIDGNQHEIDKALKMVRDRFPLKKYPELTLERVNILPQMMAVSLIPDQLYLKLIEGINNDTIISCMVAPNHLFLQQPTHPSFPGLNTLINCMNFCYRDPNSPLLPSPIPENSVCAAFSVESWYRALILSTDPETETSYVKFLDCGGYAYIENTLLRQIRGDFMLLPFQAAECFLANIKPIGETEDEMQWPEEAYTLVADLTRGAMIYTQVIDYTEDGIPLVNCYAFMSSQVVFLNEQLVNNGYAEWITYNQPLDRHEEEVELEEEEEAAAACSLAA